MRIGEWVPIYRHWVPIPPRMAMAFGLQEGSELYLARVLDTDTPNRHGYEVIVSPVPARCWRSVCRLSVRLNDYPKALAIATRFLRERRINILLTECCTTYQNRAHWDAICDVQEADGFTELREAARTNYERHMATFLDRLTEEFRTYAEERSNRFAFLQGDDQHISFSPLTGLNDAYFICDTRDVASLVHQAGAVDLPPTIVHDIETNLALTHETFPDYAIVTGNTEQRYIRVLFMRDYDQMFQVGIENDLRRFAGGGIGVLNQILQLLPSDVNLVRASNYIVTKNEESERGRIELIGYWNLPGVPKASKAAHMQEQLRQTIEAAEITDVEGRTHERTLRVVDFASPRAVYPRVYVSCSTASEEGKLHYLLRALLANLFEPVLPTSVIQVEPAAGAKAPHPFTLIGGCVAFISLQLRRSDYKVTVQTTGETRYVLPPWSIAEEVFAISKPLPLVIRLKDAAVEDATFVTNVTTKRFKSSDDYADAVADVMGELNAFRRRKDFSEALSAARAQQFQVR